MGITEVAEQFRFTGPRLAIQAIDAGHINDSFRVRCAENSYFLQRINHHIFTRPAELMQNIERVTQHLAQKDADHALRLIPTRTGASFLTHTDGTFWRAYAWIDNTRTISAEESPEQVSPEQAWQAAFAFGSFQKRLADLPGSRLHETIPNFHNTPMRFSAFEQALAADAAQRATSAQPEIAFALEHRELAQALLSLNLPERVTHNDTKFNNVLLDSATGRAICVVDLDTVMPGLAPYDFGDLVRTAATTAAEDETDLSRVSIDLTLFAALAGGYITATRDFLTPPERNALPLAGMVITFEQGIRFLADYLAGDTYYKVHHPAQNLHRCRTQFQLLRSMQQQQAQLDHALSTAP